MLKIGWFSTGRGPGSRGLLEFVQGHIRDGKLDARIQYVFSNRQPGEAEGSDEFFGLVRGYEIPLVTLSSAGFRRSRGRPWAELRQDFDRRAIGLIEPYQVDVCVLAGYMLILGGEMCRRYPFLNLHPALPDGPVGTWQEVIWELIETRAPRTGAMIHLATEQVDRGPVLSYCTVPLRGGPFDALWEEAGAAGPAGSKEENRGRSFPCSGRYGPSATPGNPTWYWKPCGRWRMGCCRRRQRIGPSGSRDASTTRLPPPWRATG